MGFRGLSESAVFRGGLLLANAAAQFGMEESYPAAKFFSRKIFGSFTKTHAVKGSQKITTT
jgi:hypothetical protein